MQRRWWVPLLLLALIFIALAGAVLYWPSPLKEEAAPKTAPSQLQDLIKKMAASKASAADWKRLKYERGAIGDGNARIPFGIALNVLPLLQADKNVNARHIRVGVERQPNGTIITSFWGRKMISSATIDWTNQKLTHGPISEDTGFEIDDTPPGEKWAGIIVSFSTLDDETTQCIGINMPVLRELRKQRFTIPYNHDGFTSLFAYSSLKYAVSAMPKVRISPHEFSSIILVDIVNIKLLGEIELPVGARDTRPVFCLDMEKDVLVATGYDLQWIMAIDLRPYMESIKGKPPPAPDNAAPKQ